MIENERLTWKKLVELEPRLLEIESQIRKSDTGQSCFCYEPHWFGRNNGAGYKAQMSRLIGWKRQHVIGQPGVTPLYTSEAYQVAYGHLIEKFPPCRKCSLHNISEYYEAQDNDDLDGWC